MTAPAWLDDRVFYQIFPERFANGNPTNDPADAADWAHDAPTRDNFFGGDLAGIRDHVPHLTRLGVNALYLTPIFAAGSNHKYDTWDYRAVDPAFGTLGDFRELVARLKGEDIRLLLDAVFNHCGDGFAPFRDVIEHGASSLYADWFTFESLPVRLDPPSYQTCGGAPFLPKLNTAHPDVRSYLFASASQWLAEGIDGWRLDVPWKAPADFWVAFRKHVAAQNPEAYLVAECWRGTSDWTRGDTVHGVMNYRLRQHILDYAAADHMDAEDFDYEVRQLLAEHQSTARAHLTLLGSHDTPRIHTLCRTVTGRTRIALALQFTLPGTPMIYYGDEIGMEGEQDPDCRRPMIWDESRWNQPIWEATRALIRLRRSHPWLGDGALRPIKTFNGVYSFAREHDQAAVIVVVNPRQAQPALRLSDALIARAGAWTDILTGQRWIAHRGMLDFEPLPAQSAFVLVPEGEPR